MFLLIDSDWDSIRVLPSSPSQLAIVDHTCILKITDQQSATTMRQYIRSHLIQWNSTSRYFTDCMREYCISRIVENILQDSNEFICVIMCLYLCGFVSEMICLNQVVSVCSYSDIELMIQSSSLNKDLICVWTFDFVNSSTFMIFHY